MYCQSCGNLLNENLNYCNRCGSKVAGGELVKRDGSNDDALSNLSASTGYVGVVGLGGFVGLIAILLGNGASPELAAVIALIFAATAFSICFLMVRQISRLSEIRMSDKKISNRKPALDELNSAAAGQIDQPRELFTSVTENTTRTLDKTKI